MKIALMLALLSLALTGEEDLCAVHGRVVLGSDAPSALAELSVVLQLPNSKSIEGPVRAGGAYRFVLACGGLPDATGPAAHVLLSVVGPPAQAQEPLVKRAVSLEGRNLVRVDIELPARAAARLAGILPAAAAPSPGRGAGGGVGFVRRALRRIAEIDDLHPRHPLWTDAPLAETPPARAKRRGAARPAPPPPSSTLPPEEPVVPVLSDPPLLDSPLARALAALALLLAAAALARARLAAAPAAPPGPPRDRGPSRAIRAGRGGAEEAGAALCAAAAELDEPDGVYLVYGGKKAV
eukprot:tig00000718_g3728.t1